MIVATEKGSHAVLSDSLLSLLRPIIRAMFVGMLIKVQYKYSIITHSLSDIKWVIMEHLYFTLSGKHF